MKTWTLGFLGVTFIAIAAEFFAIFDGNPETLPWTHYIVTYIPAWIGLPAVTIFSAWLVHHFWKYYKRKKK